MILTFIADYIDRKIKARRAYSHVFRELSLCSDRDLADMGLNAIDIPRIADESAREAEKAAIEASKRRLRHVYQNPL